MEFIHSLANYFDRNKGMHLLLNVSYLFDIRGYNKNTDKVYFCELRYETK